MPETPPKSRAPYLGVLALLFCVACNTAPDKRLLQYLNQEGFGNSYVGNAEEENYVAIGDTVELQDTMHPTEIRATQVVDIDGTILVPLAGAVHVAGYTRSELEAFLTEKYASFYGETDIQVRIRTKGKKYFIFGEVNNDGAQDFPGDLTIFEAVMRAGPDDQSANLGRVRLVRPDPIDPIVVTVNVGDMILTGDSTFNVHVQERDIILVPPTLLAQVAYFINDLLFPVNEVIRNLGNAFFGARRGRRNRNAGLGNVGFAGGIF